VLDGVPQLSPASRQKAAAFLGGFFDQISSPQDVARVLGGCLKGAAP
jgi:hypothetical protein